MKGLIVVIILALVATGAFGFLYFKANGEVKTLTQTTETQSAQLKALEGQITSIQSEAEQKVTTAEKEVVAAKEKVAEMEKAVAIANAAVEKADDTSMGRELSETKEALKTAEANLATAKSELAAAETAKAAAQAQVTSFESQVTTLSEKIEVINKEFIEAQKLAESYKLLLLNNKIALNVKKFSGNVLTVIPFEAAQDDKANYVTIDLGSNDLLPVGTAMTIVRDTKLIGEIEVVKLLEDGKMALAEVKKLYNCENPAKVSDIVSNDVGF